MAPTRLIALASAFVVFLGSFAAGQANDHPGFFARQRQDYLAGIATYPLLKQRKIDQIFHLRIAAGDLTVDTPLEGDHDYVQHRAALDGLSEPAVIVCNFLSQDLGQLQFEISVDDYTDPLIVGRLHLQARPVMKDHPTADGDAQSIDIEKIWQSQNGFRRVFFSQTPTTCTMGIFRNDGGPNGFINTNLTEKDFATLRRNHQAETEEWLRPILRELHQESAFAADPAVAWQVLSADWPVDEKLQASLADKFKALDDDDFRVRRSASDDLQKMGRDAALVMIRMDRRKLSLEQNLRIDEVVSRFKPVTDAEAKRLGSDPNFLLDCLYGEDAIARRLALKRLQAVTRKPIEFNLDASEDSRVEAVNALRGKLLADKAVAKDPH